MECAKLHPHLHRQPHSLVTFDLCQQASLCSTLLSLVTVGGDTSGAHNRQQQCQQQGGQLVGADCEKVDAKECQGVTAVGSLILYGP